MGKNIPPDPQRGVKVIYVIFDLQPLNITSQKATSANGMI